MATSGTTAFTLDIADAIGHAYRQAGKVAASGGDYQDARLALELLLQEWANEGIKFWTISSTSVSLVAGTVSYNLAAGAVDVVAAVLRSNTGEASQNDRPLSRMALTDYALLSTKLLQALPSRYVVDRQLSPQVILYPAPSTSDYTLTYWYIRKIEDAGNEGNLNLDMPTRFLPALIAGLAAKVAQFDIDYPLDRLGMLQGTYADIFQKAKDEESSRTSFRIRPSRAYRK